VARARDNSSLKRECVHFSFGMSSKCQTQKRKRTKGERNRLRYLIMFITSSYYLSLSMIYQLRNRFI
jgi:hypothetical protein